MIGGLKTKTTWRALMAFALIFWCAGAGCMIVSYAHASLTESSDPSDSAAHMMAGMSSAMEAHACCKAKHQSAEQQHHSRAAAPSDPALLTSSLLTLPSAPNQSGAMDCCPLTSGSIVVGSRPQSNYHAAVLHELSSSSLLPVSSNPPPLAVPLRLPNRAHSYLLDCAFLI